MRDVAAAAGVSAKTVSRVFNGDPHVSPGTRDRVARALSHLDYVPNTLATTFRRGRAATIGVAVPDIADPYFGAVAKSVEHVAARHDMAVVMTALGGDPADERRILESLLSRQISGLVLAPVSRDQSYLTAWVSRIALVLVDRAPSGLNADHFLEDDHGGAHRATGHLIRHGHRRIALLGDTLDLPTTANRYAGYLAALADAGVPVDEDLVVMGAGNGPGARDAVAALCALPDPPTAVFSADARCTVHLVPAMTGRRWAVVAFGDLPLADRLSPALTVIDRDPATLGRLAAERVVRRIENPTRKYRRRNVLPVRLLERESAADPGVAGLFPRSRRDVPTRP